MFKTIKRNILSEVIHNIILNLFNQFLKNYSTSVFLNGNFVNFENISSIYNKNKKILLNKSDNFFKFLDKQISIPDFDLSFFESIDKKYISFLVRKFEQLCSNNYIGFMTNDIRKKVIEKFKKIIDSIFLCTVFTNTSLNYSSISSNVRIVRAPPYLS
ncbi:hypothetical protein [Leptotrichia sp. OH3620_COT-345]|uniref:hypothetical protein n=1 Tax=Leptotrichia sp. OH3620_COT-345 TaxID=2491048 RepID=UPI0018F58EAD|nr:hypothetical protein [Leptotrichia sp. OH3620_COT-345]